MKMCEAFSDLGYTVTLIVPRRLNHIKDDPFTYYGVKKNFKIKRLPTLDLVKFGRIGFLTQSFTFSIFSFLYSILNKSDIIYSRDELPLFLLGFFKKSVVYEAHMPRFNFIIKRFTKIITISKGLKDFYIKNGVREDKLIVAPDAVDLGDFDITINKDEVKQKLGIPLN